MLVLEGRTATSLGDRGSRSGTSVTDVGTEGSVSYEFADDFVQKFFKIGADGRGCHSIASLLL